MLMNSFSPLKRSEREIIKLPRGGYIIQTKGGCIQFGIPPETMKDSMNLKIEIPTYFLLPSCWFDRFCAVAEFEFPAYFNFFVKKKKINLICSKEGAEQIKIIFQETLLGPTNFDNFKQDFDPSYPAAQIPQIAKELAYFARNPFNPSESLKIETLIDFTLFDEESQIAMISPTVGVRKDRTKFVILEDDQEIAVFRDFVRINQLMGDEEFNDYQLNIKLGLFYNPNLELEEKKVNVLKESFHEIIKEFQPPVFGVTVLGGSHGFDPKGMTTGYVLWINGRGIMIDPPVFSTQYLKRQGIPSILIDSVIITHCHADHDTGILQKILENGKIELMTTRTIMQSYLKKYSAISKIPQQQLQRFFKFRPITIGNKVTLNGGHLNFFYSFHTIPCLGFTAHFENRSIYFSGDTFYSPQKLEQLFQEGILTKERYDDLINNKWNHDIILHEAGVPPIHTPMQVLQEVGKDIKKRLYLVHCADKDVPSDLQHAKTGLENTLVIDIPGNNRLDTFRKLDILSCIDLFQNCSIKQVRDLMDACTEIQITKGKRVCNQGDIGNEFYIIVNGVVKIYSETLQFERYLYVGDWFGESALFEGDYRMANVEAVTDSKLILIKRNDFYFIFGEQGNEKTVLDSMMKLLSSRKSKTLSVIVKNHLFNNLSSNQKIQLEIIFKEKQVKKNEIIWKSGQPFTYGVLMNKGEIGFIDCFEEKVEVDMGTFVCEIDACLDEKVKLTTTLIAFKDSSIYIAKQKNLQKFLSMNPGLLVLLQGYKYLF